MTWLQPWAVWFLAGLPLIVLLYLLKVKRRPATVSTLMFWQQVMQEQPRRALFQRLRSVLSLLLHLLIFALIVGALARPTLDRLIREGSSTVVIVDVRARMKAIDAGGKTRFELARNQARAAIGNASSGRQIALLSAGADATTLVPFSGSETGLRDALDRLAPTDAAGEIEPALTLADQLLATRQGDRQIILYTDRPVSADVRQAHPSLVVRAVGSPRENAAIVRFAARPLPASPSTSEVLLEIRNYSAQPLKTELELRYDDKLLDVKPVNLEAGGKQTLLFPSLPRPGNAAKGQLTAKLVQSDALMEDNVARVWLPPPRPIRVLLVSSGNAFLEKALAADPGVSFELLDSQAWNAAIAAKFDVVLLDNFLPPEPEPVTNTFYTNRTPFAGHGAALEAPPITDIDGEHPAMRLLDFTRTTILRAQPLSLPAPTEAWSYSAPLRSFDHPLLVVGEQRGAKPRRIAALALDLSVTDLPLRVAFPLLISNTVHWLAGAGVENANGLRAGETLRLRDGETVMATPPITGFFQPMTNGFYPLSREGRTEWVAVNTFDEAESDLTFKAEPTAKAAEIQPAKWASIPGFTAWPLWRYLALAALVLFTLEWSLFHRRRTE